MGIPDCGEKDFECRISNCGLERKKHFGLRIGKEKFRMSDVELRKNKCRMANVGWRI